jgi:outer membrane protein assembly factor BamB
MYNAPLVAGGLVFIAPQDGYVYALQASDGHEVWGFQRDAQVDGYPIVAGGMLYVADDSAVVYALNMRSGRLHWRFTLTDAHDHIYAAPAVADGLVFVSAGSGFYALDAASGHVRWSDTQDGTFDGVPATAHGVVYAGALNGGIYAFRETGGELWAYSTAGLPIISQPVIQGGLVYVGAGDATLYTLDALHGTVRWRFATPDTPAQTSRGSLPHGCAPSLANGVIYLSSQSGNLYALDANSGKRLWQFSDPYNLSPAPAVNDGAVYVVGDDGTLFALRASDGALAWTHAVNGSVYGNLAIG